MEKIRVNVQIGAEEYIVTGVESEEYIETVARYVDNKMQELHNSQTLGGQSVLAMLTALNIADELFKAQEKNAELQEELVIAQQNMKREITRVAVVDEQGKPLRVVDTIRSQSDDPDKALEEELQRALEEGEPVDEEE